MLRTGDPSPEFGGRSVSLDASTAGTVRLPEGFPLFGAEYMRDGVDLVATGPDGGAVVLRGFFAAADPPALVSPNGARISGDLVAGLAGPRGPTALTEALFGPGPALVGTIETADGSLVVTTRVGIGHSPLPSPKNGYWQLSYHVGGSQHLNW